MASIEEAYCWEMQKIVTQYQARVAFFSSNNPHLKFHFYCKTCGIPLIGVNVTSRRVLDFSINVTPHFKKHSGDSHRFTNCTSSASPSKGTTKSPIKSTSTPNEFYYTHFLLNPLDTGIAKHLPSTAVPTSISKTVLDSAPIFMPTYTIEQTSIFMDIVDCYKELQVRGKTNQVNLRIDDSILLDRTYAQTFKPFKSMLDFFEKNNHNVVKYRIHYGKVLNNSKINEQNGALWSFYIRNEEQIKWKGQNLTFEIQLPISVLNANVAIKNLIENALKDGKQIDQCFIVNTEPETPRLVSNKKDTSKEHYESRIVINNLDYIVFTFKS